MTLVDPVRIGPTWQRGPDGKFMLPERTLGWHVLAWTRLNLQHGDGRPWRYTPEQARFVLWWYAVDEDLRWVFRDGVLQRLKGWGKDPVAATLSAVEFVGPSRPTAGFAEARNEWGVPEGQPLGGQHPTPWVQIAAVSKEQTRNTMTIFPSMFTEAAIEEYSIDIGKEIIYGEGGRARIEAVTSSPRTLEGGRPTATIRNETHHWLANNEGHEMDAVIDRNATKSADGMSRALSITNAFEPSEDSVGQRAREAYESMAAGTSLVTGILYDSLEAPPDAPLTAEAAPAVIAAIRGDSTWLDIPRIVQSILDPRNPPSRSRRFWYNQITAAEDAWVVPQDFDDCGRDDIALAPREQIALFFDGSKSDDATALVGCRISDGHVVTLGMWQRPPGERGALWTSPRDRVDEAVSGVFERYAVVAFFADPSHVKDDETQERYWDALIDEWHRRYRATLVVWAIPGKQGHSVMWDMASPARSAEFTAAAERCAADITSKALTHDNDARLRIHVHNARRYPNRYGVSLWKGHRESSRKVDLAVAMVGARMARREFLNLSSTKKPRSGKVW